MRAFVPWHVNTENSIPPTILDDPVSLLNEDFLGLHLLESCKSFFNYLKFMSLLCWRGNCWFFDHIRLYQILIDLLLSIYSDFIKTLKLLPLFIERHLDYTLTPQCRQVISPYQTWGCLSLCVYIAIKDLIIPWDTDKGRAWSHIRVDCSYSRWVLFCW